MDRLGDPLQLQIFHMIKEWLAAAVGALTLFGASTATPDHRQLGGPKGATTTAGRALDAQCVRTAVAAREAAIGAATVTLGSDLSSAFTARAAALDTAYSHGSQPAIKQSVKSAWTTFAAAQKVAKRNWKNARDQAWLTFKNAMKSCGAATASLSDQDHSSVENQ